MDEVCIFIALALMWMHSAAEQQYYPRVETLTWDEARNHCKVCFKELVTLTPENSQTMVQNLTSDHWVGLRKNLDPNHMSWSRWANGDPLAFQNWYPGQPSVQSNFSTPITNCCSCSCTCPAMWDSTNSSSFMRLYLNDTGQNVTGYETSEIASECVRTPMFPDPIDSYPEDNYTEDYCVAMHSFGAWVEKNCSDQLPFICYDDSFFGHVNVSDVSSSGAVLTWQWELDSISHYRLEMEGEVPVKLEELTYDLTNLTAGTKYSVQVVPVKCQRDLNAQEATFFTKPNKVENLTATDVTNTTIALSWDKPAGNVAFYVIKVEGRETVSFNQSVVVDRLTPGNVYNIAVISRVDDKSIWSEESIVQRTKPGMVSNLSVFENNQTSLLLGWVPPKGKLTQYRVTADVDDPNFELLTKTVTEEEEKFTVTGLPMGARVTLSVTALANQMEGESVTVISYTKPGAISNLLLKTSHNTVNASWSPPEGNYSCFTVVLQLYNKTVIETDNLKEPKIDYKGLKTAANYTLRVNAVSGNFSGPVESNSVFTLPQPPSNLVFSSFNESQITLQWTAPPNIAKISYSVVINSSFWGYRQTVAVEDNTSHTFTNLKSGTKYGFGVKTVAGLLESEIVSNSSFTVAVEKEITLSMLCSSKTPLLCDNSATRLNVIDQLREHFKELLQDDVFWELKEQQPEI